MYQCHGACAEVDSDTEAVAGKGFKLGCISCKRRSEVAGSATIEWYFRAKGEADFVRVSATLKFKFCFHTTAQIQSKGWFYASKGVLVVRAAIQLKKNTKAALLRTEGIDRIYHNLSSFFSHSPLISTALIRG